MSRVLPSARPLLLLAAASSCPRSPYGKTRSGGSPWEPGWGGTSNGLNTSRTFLVFPFEDHTLEGKSHLERKNKLFGGRFGVFLMPCFFIPTLVVQAVGTLYVFAHYAAVGQLRRCRKSVWWVRFPGHIHGGAACFLFASFLCCLFVLYGLNSPSTPASAPISSRCCMFIHHSCYQSTEHK